MKFKFTDIAFLQSAPWRQVDGQASITHRVERGADAQLSPCDPLMLASDTGHGKTGHGTISPKPCGLSYSYVLEHHTGSLASASVSRDSFPTAMGAAGLEYVPALVITAPASWLRISKGQGGASQSLLGKWGVTAEKSLSPPLPPFSSGTQKAEAQKSPGSVSRWRLHLASPHPTPPPTSL